MAYGIEIKIADGFDTMTGGPAFKWVRIRPTGGKPYTWPTRAEAADMRRMCYPDEAPENVRIVEVTA